MVGAGVLSLPYAMAYLGWGAGVMVMVLSWCITLHSMWQMTQLHECVTEVRFDRYVDLGWHAFGTKLGAWIVLPQQLIVQVGCDIVYMVTGGKCLMKFMEIACTNCTPIRQSYWICIFAGSTFSCLSCRILTLSLVFRWQLQLCHSSNKSCFLDFFFFLF
ncbi:lysine histidine transporter-like 6 [Phtheirospermum japonicum]|uniref:Lysine histidine transporter-like 6 n=1 Tax=Phtheirospermum japonicum TaxID=374723 RepID=A0A830C3F3_9LAMI|nr:lysine histidine transporter-like 6 [Phtheirospermum japonicum]